MKKLVLIAISFGIITSVSAKKVKFAVNMTGQTINSTLVHVWGDFQVAAGYASDWAPNLTQLTQVDADTNIYSIVVDIPAFAKYEYTFLNGDQGYDAEFVPIESRVGYNFDSNRWIYVDSLGDDTTFVGAVLFAGNAPAGLTLVRFLVNMQNEPSVSSGGVHVAGTFQGWDASQTILYSFDPGVYEVIQYVTTGIYNYKFYNGNTTDDGETITGSCSVFGNREINVTADIVLAKVCFGDCADCTVGVNEIESAQSLKAYPNPFHDYAIIELGNSGVYSVKITDVTGRVVRFYSHLTFPSLRIERGNFNSGMYFVSIADSENKNQAIAKLVIE
jgi:hypothetical protein